MARNIFRLSFALHPQEGKTIKEMAICILSLLEMLRREDDVFSRFAYAKLNFKNVDFDLTTLGFNDAVEKLSQLILRTNLSDIREYNKVKNPTVDFARDIGFRTLFIFFKNGKEHFSITGDISTRQYPSLSITHFPFENSDYNFDWYFKMLKITTEFFNPIFSGVRIVLDSFIDECRDINIIYPLGWVTYFSHESKIEIPPDLGFEMEKTDKGIYLILTREDFTQNKEDYFLAKDKLLEAMEKIKKNSVNYSDTLRR